MVATKLSEVASKGYGWATGSTETPGPPTPPRPTNIAQQDGTNIAPSGNSSFSSPSALWDAASNSLSSAKDSLSSAADQAYSTVAGAANYAWETGYGTGQELSGSAPPNHPTQEMDQQSSSSWLQTVANNHNNNPAFGSPLKLQNPYNRVRGRYHAQNQSSLSAVRSLLPLVTENNEMTYHPLITEIDDSELMLTEQSEDSKLQRSMESSQRESSTRGRLSSVNLSTPDTSETYSSTPAASQIHKNSETASQLAEGTVRALRDIALDEAVDLYSALRFWSERWEQPLLSWLEAGPPVWFSRDGYDHQLVGQKVAQIQAVLARRCVAIGELQQHLLRAGWQRGVAQWGVLGQNQWATVQGTYVMTEETAALSQRTLVDDDNSNNNRPLSESTESLHGVRPTERIGMNNHPSRSVSNQSTSSKRSDRKKWKREYKGYYASVFVRNEDDGKILMDDAALAEWSVDAMALIRDLLMRASNGKATLPYEHHWKSTTNTGTHNNKQPLESRSSFFEESEQGELIVEEEPQQPPPADNNGGAQEGLEPRQLPVWAQWASKAAALGGSYGEEFDRTNNAVLSGEDDNVVISNLPLMAAEVSELLDAIENIMPLQKSRRMIWLKPPSMLRRRWYLTLVAAPGLTYLGHKLFMKGYGSKVVRVALSKIYQFFQERVVIPFVAIVEEIWKGQEDISDKQARIEVIAGLKEMIRNWLDDNHPEIPVAERLAMAERMDISLIERKKAESLKTLFELNQAVRLSFIEMQFIKKEMVNALYTMDEMMTKNEINTNLAAVTPAVLMLYTAQQIFRFFYYALLKLGKSKEETYASFRQILTDIERLLTMRSNPPSSPFPNHHNVRHTGDTVEEASQSHFHPGERSCHCDVLSADDLGMLMLHIHECRTILWRDHSRFTAGMIQNVSEDLAELAGERGAVSVQQQLQIIARMCRTYPFLKVISIGTTFHERFIGRI